MELSASIPALLAQRSASHGAEIILRKKDRGIWKAVTWRELAAHVREIGQGLLAIGMGTGDVAAVLSETRPEAVFADLAILGAGCASLAIHPDEEAHSAARMLHAAGCRCLFVENEEQLDKVLSVRGDCPALAHIVILDAKGLRDFSDPQCKVLQSFIDAGASQTGWEAASAAVTANRPALILFPRGDAGGTGRMLSHGDVLHLVASARARLGVKPGDERLVVLPMCDVTEHVLGLYLALDSRIISNYLESPETARENLQEVQPTVLGADAEAWERLHARVAGAADGATPLQRTLYRWAIKAGQSGGTQAALANILVLRAVQRELGLTKLRHAYIGGAPLPPHLEQWATALGIDIQRIDAPPASGAPADARYLALMGDACCGT